MSAIGRRRENPHLSMKTPPDQKSSSQESAGTDATEDKSAETTDQAGTGGDEKPSKSKAKKAASTGIVSWLLGDFNDD